MDTHQCFFLRFIFIVFNYLSVYRHMNMCVDASGGQGSRARATGGYELPVQLPGIELRSLEKQLSVLNR